VPAVSEPLNLHLDDIADVKELSKLFDRVLICDDAARSNVERAVNSILSVVLDKGLYDVTYVELLNTLNMSVDESILSTERGISHYLVEDCYVFIVLLSVLVELMLYHQMPVLTLHPLVHLG